MTEKSIMPLNSYSAYTPPFQYTPLIDLQIQFSKLYQQRISHRKQISSKHENNTNNSFDFTQADLYKYNRKILPQKQFIFGSEIEEIPRPNLASIIKHKKVYSLNENTPKPAEIPELFISKSPTKLIRRFISPYIRDTKETPKSVKEIRKSAKNNKKKLPFLPFHEDEVVKLKEELFDYFMKTLRLSNGIALRVNQAKNYKFFVGPGNNSELVVKVLRNRPWWTRCEKAKEAHFVWTSTKHKKTLEKMTEGNRVFLRLGQVNRKMTLKKVKNFEKFGYHLIAGAGVYRSLENDEGLDTANLKVHNRLEHNKHLISKKRLYTNLKRYYEELGLDPFDYIPITFHIKSGVQDQSFSNFKDTFSELLTKSNQKVWIVKPGENTNRGKGIKVCNSVENISEIISSQIGSRTYIVQKYIEKPFLIYKRKFDIRCFGLLTSFNNNIQGYFYPEGYIRTSSKEFSTKSFNRFIHLTNDAVQKNSEEYGKFEPGNKISYLDFQTYLNQELPLSKIDFEKQINSQIRNIVKDTFKATYSIVDPNRKLHCFELFGYDFMVDENFKVWLIEVNTNPCLELSCGYLSKLIPAVLDNTFRLTVDQMFCPEADSKKFQKWIPDGSIFNKFELIFNEIAKN